MNILGLGFTDHEASAALVVDGALATVVARERISRLKRDGKMWGSQRLDLTPAIDYCLDANGIRLADVDLISWNHIDHVSDKDVLQTIASEGGVDLSHVPRFVLPHHFAHAVYAFYSSPFTKAAILVVDGSGGPLSGIKQRCHGPESASLKSGQTVVQNLRPDGSDEAREHESFYVFDGKRWYCLRKIAGDWGGIGAEYGSASSFLFGDPLDAGKTMGLAPYGVPDESYSFLKRCGPKDQPVFRSFHPEGRDEIEEQIRQLRRDTSGFDYTHPLTAAFAATIQAEMELALLDHALWLREVSNIPNLCLSGGVALNCVANARLAREGGYSDLFVPPAPGDDGISVGCALYAAAAHGELKRETFQRPPYFARRYAVNRDLGVRQGLSAVHNATSLTVTVAERIAEGAVVAWYQGEAELGPRALGHRSFLADPRNPGMRDHLNHHIKGRERFRPFAPVVLDEAVLEFFEDRFPSYYMSFVARVRGDKRAFLPAVTHVDGTARYQVLRDFDNPQLHELLTAFAKLTGIPLLLNTSLNRAGEPLVETPEDAIRCFRASGADYLVLDGTLYARGGARPNGD